MDSVLKTWGLPLLCLAVISTASFIYFQRPEKPSPAPAQLMPASDPTTLLALSPENLKIKVGETAMLTVEIDTSTDSVSAVEINLTYSPKVVTVESVSADNFFDKPVVLGKNIDNILGQAILSLGTLKPKQGKGSIAALKVKGVKKGTSNFDLATSQVAATGKIANVAKITTVGKITVE